MGLLWQKGLGSFGISCGVIGLRWPRPLAEGQSVPWMAEGFGGLALSLRACMLRPPGPLFVLLGEMLGFHFGSGGGFPSLGSVRSSPYTYSPGFRPIRSGGLKPSVDLKRLLFSGLRVSSFGCLVL
ncbi:hypothetical protein OIU76_020756 [Salix suchowensis]|nr:hypothetical protein OIU76_020756 [Salix suchowensis]